MLEINEIINELLENGQFDFNPKIEDIIAKYPVTNKMVYEWLKILAVLSEAGIDIKLVLNQLAKHPSCRAALICSDILPVGYVVFKNCEKIGETNEENK